MIPYEYAENRGGKLDRVLSDWPLEARERRALAVMLTMLFGLDIRQATGSVVFRFKADPPDIYYAKATGNVQLRPRLCRGPERPNDEVTFLVRAIEKGDKVIPPDAGRSAARLREEITESPSLRIRYRPKKEETS